MTYYSGKPIGERLFGRVLKVAKIRQMFYPRDKGCASPFNPNADGYCDFSEGVMRCHYCDEFGDRPDEALDECGHCDRMLAADEECDCDGAA